ncbi:MAG: hypothetical protein MUE72_12090 [Chitinophagaceae bacterium]|jgi:hypothetical protein|nr:hypothetical protein [Chitinophagaceae bacterium]
MNLDQPVYEEECQCGQTLYHSHIQTYIKCKRCKKRYIVIDHELKRNWIKEGVAIPSKDKYLSTIHMMEIFERNFKTLLDLERNSKLNPISATFPIQSIVRMFFEIDKIHHTPYIVLHPYLYREIDASIIFMNAVRLMLEYEEKGLLMPGVNILDDYTRQFYDALKKLYN